MIRAEIPDPLADAAPGTVGPVDPDTGLRPVRGRSGQTYYCRLGDMTRDIEPFCSCADFKHRRAIALTPCRHIRLTPEFQERYPAVTVDGIDPIDEECARG